METRTRLRGQRYRTWLVVLLFLFFGPAITAERQAGTSSTHMIDYRRMDSCSTLRIRQSSMCVYDILVFWQLFIKLLIFGPAARSQLLLIQYKDMKSYSCYVHPRRPVQRPVITRQSPDARLQVVKSSMRNPDSSSVLKDFNLQH